MKKKYRNAIIGGILGGVTSAIIIFPILGYFSWTFLILSVILSPLALLTGLKMREMKLSNKRRLILNIIFLATAVVLYPTFSMHRRMSKLYMIADRESVFKFMSFELRHFGGRAVTDEIELPPQVVPVYSLEDFEKFRELCGGPTVYTMMRPTRADFPNHFSDNKRTLRTTYFRTYYFFNNAGTIAWEYTHTLKFKVQLQGED